MADLVRTADSVAVQYPMQAEIYPVILTETATRGQAGYEVAATGKVGIADANGSGKQQFRGIILEPGAAGQGVSLLKRGACQGWDVSGMDYDDLVYLSDTVGELSDTVGTMTVPVGRVMGMSDAARTKMIYFDANWITTWA